MGPMGAFTNIPALKCPYSFNSHLQDYRESQWRPRLDWISRQPSERGSKADYSHLQSPFSSGRQVSEILNL